MAIQLPIENGGLLGGDAGRAQKLIGTVVLGSDAQWYEITAVKSRRNPISVDYIGYGKAISEKTALGTLRLMHARKQADTARDAINNLAIQPHRATELAEAQASKSAAEAVLAAAGKKAEKIQSGAIYLISQNRLMRELVAV